MTAALDLVAWLTRATKPGSAAIRERYKISTQVWNSAIRPDVNAECVLTYLRAWQATGDAAHLTKSRAIWDAFKGLQTPSGWWPFTDTVSQIWINDQAEVSIFLLRSAEVDEVNAAAYRAAALDTCDYLVSVQNPTTKLWAAGTYTGYQSALFTAHAVTALATAYPLAGANQAAYLTAIETGLTAIAAKIGGDGRVQTGYEVHGIEESWRPPASDNALCIRAYATAERAFPAHASVTTWATHRHALHGWLDGLIHASGAVRNGYGVGCTLADVTHVTDHVYTTAFAIEAYRLSAATDSSPAYAAIAAGISAFAAGNIWYSANPDANGCLRGAYDLTAQDFNTGEIPQNAGEEGGGDMAYTGWSAAPVAALLFEAAPVVSAGRRGASAVAFL